MPTADNESGSTWRIGAPDRAEALSRRADADQKAAAAEPLAQRREVLLESARRLARLAEAERRVVQDA